MRVWKISTLLLLIIGVVLGSENLYDLLEVTQHATSDQIKKAFRKLSIKHHPDKNTDKPDAQAFYLKIKRAYEVLIDVSKRNTYDLFGQEGLAEIQKRPKPKGGDYRPDMPIPLSKFYEGGPMTFPFRRGQICRRCKGSGDEGGVLHPCQACGGSGKMKRTVQVQGKTKQMQMKCNKCQGSGKAPKQVCPVCHGQKIQLKPRDLSFEVEKGMVDGDKVMFKGQSEQGLEFYPGDVIVTLKQQPHPYLTRQKNDLKTSIKISLKQAILGFERKIKQLDNRDIQIVGDYNIQDEEIIKIQGEGMPIRGQLGSYGDLLAEVNINFPKSYTQQQLSEIRKIFDAGEDREEL